MTPEQYDLTVVLIVAACFALFMLPFWVWDKTESKERLVALFCILAVEAGAVEAVIRSLPKQTTYELSVADWQCSSTYEVRRFSGKTWHTATECAEYSRKEEP
jgi:hypothetical protein